MGMEISDEDKTLALALGGMKEGFTLPQLVNGYAALANGGEYAAARTIAESKTDRVKSCSRTSR